MRANTARELMTPDPVSIRDSATLTEALDLLITRGFRAAPVIDAAGHPVGVLSQTDILAHNREKREPSPTRPLVRDLMTPAVFSVSPDAVAARVVEELLALSVHRLFVVDRDGVLIGVVTAQDVLRRLGE
jgi:CBS domain-containing protein